jgi:hypothetical protein
VLQSPSRIEELIKIFIHATKVRLLFWGEASGGCNVDILADGDGILGHGYGASMRYEIDVTGDRVSILTLTLSVCNP